MNPTDTVFTQEGVESPIYWIAQLNDLSHFITYDVFGASYVGQNDWSILGRIDTPAPDSISINGPFPGPGDFDN